MPECFGDVFNVLCTNKYAFLEADRNISYCALLTLIF